MYRKLLLAIIAVSLSSMVDAGEAAEKTIKVKRLPLTAPKNKVKAKFPVKVTVPFDTLVSTRYSRHLTALKALVARGNELSTAAAAEAKRLDALPEQENKSVQAVLDSVIAALQAIGAERVVMTKWKKGLSAKAEKVSGKQVDLSCTNLAIGKLLKRASKSWGVEIELSPVAGKLKQTLDLDLKGAPTLKEFLNWLAARESLTYGYAGTTLVLVPGCSLELKKALERQQRQKAKVKLKSKSGK
jgi:hypothetical protein